jgi:hypothetical protein
VSAAPGADLDLRQIEQFLYREARYADETIIWLPGGHLSQLLDPSADRWRDA